MHMLRFRLISIIVLILSLVCQSMAQQNIAANRQPRPSRITRNEIKRVENRKPIAGLVEKQGNQINFLLKRKIALQRYMLSVSPDSPDYRVTEAAIREISLKLVAINDNARNVSPNVVIPLSVPPAAPTPAFQPGKSLNDFLVEKIKSKVDQTSITKQTETPSMSDNSTSLVDQSSASDLIGLAMNLSGLSFKTDTPDKMEADSMSVTASAYSLYAALQGVDPLNPIFYNQNRGWRQVSVTLGYDNEKADGTATTDRARIFGVKVLLWDKRDPNDQTYQGDFDKVGEQLKDSNVQFGEYYRHIIIYIFKENAKTMEIIKQEFSQFLVAEKAKAGADTDDIDSAAERFKNGDAFKFRPDNRFDENGLTDAELKYFAQFQNDYLTYNSKKKFSQAILDDINKFVDDELKTGFESFARLDETASDLIKRIRTAPQFSFSALTKQRQNGADDYSGQLIFDYGLADRVNLTLNGAFNYVNSKITGGDTRGGTFAGQLQFRFSKQPDSITGKKSVYFYLSTNDKWATSSKPLFMGQAKLTIPIADGFELPLSLVFASRTNASNKNILKGQFAFTLDTARLLRAVLSK